MTSPSQFFRTHMSPRLVLSPAGAASPTKRMPTALLAHLVSSCRQAMSNLPLREALAATRLPAQPAASVLSLLQTERSQLKARIGSLPTSRGLSTGTKWEAYYPSQPAS